MKSFQAFDAQGSLWIPEVNVILTPKDKLIPLRGYRHIVGVKRKGEIVGWAAVYEVPKKLKGTIL
jgi:hypothetical protein